MKAMGLTRLCLVAPSRFPSAEATAMAAGADEVLYHAGVHASLPEALAGCGLVVGTSARRRGIAWPEATPGAAAAEILDAARHGEVALVFGPERSGLANTDLETCQLMVRIPTAPDFSSLNLAAAVQIMAYEIRQAALDAGPMGQRPEARSATAEELGQLYDHLEETLVAVGFLDRAKPGRLMHRLKRLFNRARLDQNELNILRGFLAAVQGRRGKVHPVNESIGRGSGGSRRKGTPGSRRPSPPASRSPAS
jgi:tRNA (cytidine32/uridine32-2'-O)-methyltransferase